jgi:outer membrane protein assembly factor BamB
VNCTPAFGLKLAELHGNLAVYRIEQGGFDVAFASQLRGRNEEISMIKQALCGVAMWLVASLTLAEEFDQQKMENWHQWRGPMATGVAPLGDPPTEWSETKNIKWKVAIPGRGSASPVVWGERIFILTAIKTDRTAEPAEAAHIAPRVQLVAHEKQDAARPLLAQRGEQPPGGERGSRRGFGGGRFGIEPPANYYQFVVLCLDRKTGKTIWQRTACEVIPHEGHHQTGSFASASPITDGKYIYASFGSRGIYCYDLAGNPQWDKDLGDMQVRFSFGEGSSPALWGDTLVVQWDHEGDDFIVTLDARTGNEKWRAPRDEPSTWATPLVVETTDSAQVITSGTNRVRSYDLASGELIWECGGLGSNPIATPVTIGGLAIAMSGHRDPAGIAVPLSARGDVTGSDQIAWQIEGSTPYVSTPVLYDDTLYFIKSRNAIVSSVNAKTGAAIIDQRRLPGMDSLYSSPVAAQGRIYFSSREGTTVVIEHAPSLRILATNELGETIDASPAIVGNEMIVRGESHLYCIAE